MNKIIVFITLLLLICGCFVSCTPNAIGDTDRESESTQKADGSEDSNITPGTNKPADSSSGSSDSALGTDSDKVTTSDTEKDANTDSSKVTGTDSKPSTSPDTTQEITPGTKPEPKPEPEPEPEIVLPQSHNQQFDASKLGIYNYCPSIMQVDDNTRYIYYCTNQKSYNVTDYIGCRKGTKNPDGSWSWSSEKIVLSPDKGTWDERHVCDPSVVAGEFKYNGETYSYLMAYLGCVTSNSQENDLGIAVAKSPEGPFVKVGTAPLVDFVRNTSVNQDLFQWGVGQPSLINMDKKGDIMLFYTRGDYNATRTIVERWDLSDLNSPQKKSSVKLSERGLINLNGGSDILNNADFVYDAKNKRFYSSSDCHPNPTGTPDYISSHFRVCYFDEPSSYSSFTWSYLSTVGPTETGFARNHNTGILRDAYGHLPNGYVTVYYTVSTTGSLSLWSYRIYDYHVKIN